MSSGIEKNVPLFTGDDYPGWSVSMESYLMASGVWHVIDDFISDTSKTTSGAPAGAQVTAPGGSALPGALPFTGTSTTSSGAASAGAASAASSELATFKKDKDWKMADIKAQGFIRLRVDNNIVDKLKPLKCAFDMWALLEYEYGQLGLAGAFNVWRKALAVSVPTNSNPAAAIDKIGGYIRRLHELGIEIPTFIHGLIIISKLPPYMALVSEMAAQATGIASISPTKIRQSAINAWENKQSGGNKGKNGNGNGGDANKITAVKRNNGNRSFDSQQQGNQQQQRGQGSGKQQQQQGDPKQQRDKSKKRGRGPRKGKGKNAANVQEDSDNDLESLVSNAVVREPTYYPLGHVGEGELVTLSLKSNLAPPPRAASSKVYPDLTRASRLAHQVGVKGTPQALRTLEKVVASGFVRDVPLLSRIQEVDDVYNSLEDETPYSTGEGEDQYEEDEEDERAAKRFKSISLLDRMEPRPFEYNESAWRDEPIPDGTSFGEDDQIANAAGVDEEPESVPLSHTHAQCAHHCSTASAERDARPQVGYLDNWMTLANGLVVPINDNLCVHSKDYAMCGKCKGKSSASHVCSSDWLLDSGASNIYTMDMSDFVECSRKKA